MNKKTLKNLLFPTDFSVLSGKALGTAVAMCKRQQAILHILHVVENKPLSGSPDAGASHENVNPGMGKTAAKHLNALEKKITSKYNIKVNTCLEFGSPAETIGDKAIQLHCDLIVMGTHGASGFREFFIGSNAYHVIKNTSIPVLTIPGKKKVKEFRKILFPVRSSKGIMDKYDFIEPIIQKNNAELFIAALSLPGEGYNLSPLDENIRELGRSHRISKTKFRSEYFVCKNYAKKVLALAKKEKADLIVINASLDYKWRQFFIGPYTQQVVNHSAIPVLSIRTVNPDTVFAEAVKEDIRNAFQDSLIY